MVEFSPKAAAKTKKVVTDYLRTSPGESGPDVPGRGRQIFFDGKLTSELDAGGLADPTTATFEFWIPNSASTDDPKPYIASGETQTLVNRSTSLTGSVGTAIVIARVKNEWRIIWADC